MNEKYYSLVVFKEKNEAHIYIFGYITSWKWIESDVSSYTLAKEIEGLDVDHIFVHINSYGGEVAEGWAIHNNLKNHKAEIITICDGFACSIAAHIFMAGEVRMMNTTSALMIHNTWTRASGDHNKLRKTADDIEKMTNSTIKSYLKAGVSVSEKDLKKMLDEETWLYSSEAVEMGFATATCDDAGTDKPSACAKSSLIELLKAGLAAKSSEPMTIEKLSRKMASMNKSVKGITSMVAELNEKYSPQSGGDPQPQLPKPGPEPEPEPDQENNAQDKAAAKKAALFNALLNTVNKK